MSARATADDRAQASNPASAGRTTGNAGSRIALVLVGNVFPPAAAFITSPLLAHTLGAEGRGLVSGATAPLLLVLGAATLGLPEAVTYSIASGASGAKVIKSAALWTAFAGLASTILVIALAAPLSGHDPSLAGLTALVAFAAAPGLLVGVARGAAAGIGAWGLVTVDRVLQGVFRLTVLLALALLGRLSVTSAALTIAAGAVIGVLAYVPLIPAMRARDSDGPFALMHFGLRNWSGSLSGILVSRVDQSLMVPLSNPFELGVYAVSVSISELPLVFNNAVRDVIFAVESERSDGTRLAAAARISTTLTAVAGLAVGGLAAVFMTQLFGSDFRSAVGVTAVLLLAVVGGNPGSIAGMGLSARGRPGLRSLSLTIGLVVDLAVLVLLAPHLGAMGAAIATLFANCSCAVFNLYWLRRCHGIPMRSFMGLRSSDVEAIVSIVRSAMAGRLRRSSAGV